jgi:predicted RNase H-like HicB family nuclease
MKKTANAPEYSTIVQLVNDKDGMYYLAMHPELEGCFSDGSTIEEATANLAEVTEMLLEHLRENHLPIPSPQPLFFTPEELVQRQAKPIGGATLDAPKLDVLPIPA